MAKTNYYEYDFYKTLGQILREKRIERGMTLDDAASAIGKTIKTVQRYETGERKITVQTIKDLCHVYGADPDEIMMMAQNQPESDDVGSDAIGTRIRERREQLHMTQDDLARKLGYTSRSTIAKIEAGQNELRQNRIMQMAEALHTSPSYLMGWTDDPELESEPKAPLRSESTEELLERAFSGRPEMRMLFSVAENATKEDIEKAIKIIEALKSDDYE